MRIINRYLTVILLPILFTPIAFSNTCIPNERKLHIFFANGMFNDADNIKLSLNELKKQTEHIFSNYTEVKYSISFNESEAEQEGIVNFIYELDEVLTQRINENEYLFYQWIQGLDAIPDWLTEKLADVIQQTNQSSYINDSDLKQHVDTYTHSIEACYQVLVIAHSQGNFYTNSAWDLVYAGVRLNKYKQNSFPSMGYVAVASPAGHQGSNLKSPLRLNDYADYVNLKNDWVLNLVGIAYPILESQYKNTSSDTDLIHHSFLNSYISGNNTRPALLSSIVNITDKLESLPYRRESVVPNMGIKEFAYSGISKVLDIQLAPKNTLYRFIKVSELDVQRLRSNIENDEAYTSNFCPIFINKNNNILLHNYRLIDGTHQGAEAYSESMILEMTNTEWTHDWLFSSLVKTYGGDQQDFEEISELKLHIKHLYPYTEATCTGRVGFFYEEFIDDMPVITCHSESYEVLFNSGNECYWGSVIAEIIILDPYYW